MRILFLDLETTDTVKYKKKRDPSPFLPSNFLVSYGWKTYGYDQDTAGYRFLCHRDVSGDTRPSVEHLQYLLDECELLVAFNAKFELNWLLEAGFKYARKINCPMVTEYILARGLRVDLDLDSCCLRRGTIRKLGVLIDDLWAEGRSFYEMPMPIVEEYGIRDVECVYELYFAHQKLLELGENKSLIPTIQMSHEFIWCLVEMERNGIYIDDKSLSQVKEEFTNEHRQLRRDLERIATEVCGDSVLNLDSPEQLSTLIYSRRVKDKRAWKEIFNIGTDARGKRRRPPRMSSNEFVATVKSHTELFMQSTSSHCGTCGGKGRLLDKLTKSGQLYKKQPYCSDCDGKGYRLVNTGKVAGLRLSPTGPIDTAAGGFATDKETIGSLIRRCDVTKQIGLSAKEFLTKLVRYGAIGTYLDTFVDGIERGRGSNGILHTQLMQCITRTGRLSSQNPNFQNMPRALTFPVRKVVKSRFTGGRIIEVDFAQLEFRAAAYIYQCRTAIQTILDKVDVHAYTASIIECSRQDAKPHTFKPLYGGSSGTEAEQRYYKAFKEKYTGVTDGQNKDIQQVIKTGRLTIPSGRQYDFVGTRRTPSGYVTNTTQICNYPVQGFATADIVPVVIIELYKEFKRAGLRSLIILTVHDSVVLDCGQEELGLVLEAINKVFSNLLNILRDRYGVVINVPLDWETKIGNNWMEMKNV